METKSGRRKTPNTGAATDGMAELRQSLAKRLSETRAMVNTFDEAMDYATHCALQGFAEGLAFALEEVEQAMKKEGAGKKGGVRRKAGE